MWWGPTCEDPGIPRSGDKGSGEWVSVCLEGEGRKRELEKKRRNSNKGLSLLKTTRFIQRAGEVLGGWEGLAGKEAQGEP